MRTVHKILVLGIAALTLMNSAIAETSDTQTYTLNIASQPLDTALTQLAHQSGMQLAVYPQDCEGFMAPRLEGSYTLQAALERLLVNTSLRYERVNDRTIAIRKAVTSTNSNSASPATTESSGPVRLAKAETSSASLGGQESTVGDDSRGDVDPKKKSDRLDRQEMTVTGTQIRGSAPVGSQVLVFTREDFDRAGAATPQQFLATLPQNFGGQYSDDSYLAPSTTIAYDPSYGSGVNLRGLGSSATLVLLNGRRLPKPGRANYADISMVPMSAIERIEVLTDGASSIYGSDAIGGVVNIITRSDYRAAETRVRGSVTGRKDGEEIQVAQSAGTGWKSGNVLLSYEHYRREPIDGLERGFSAEGGSPYDLQPKQDKNAALLSVKQALSSNFDVAAGFGYAERDSFPKSWDDAMGAMLNISSHNAETTVALEAGLDLKGWSAILRADGGRTRTKTFSMLSEMTTLEAHDESDVGSMDLTVTGELFSLPAGDVAVAVGGGYKEEGFEFVSALITQPRRTFNTQWAFAEFMVPLHRNRNRADLRASLAGRYEQYSNFGETFDPKFGIEWAPLSSVRIRGSYSTSFKAPSLFQINEWNASYRITALTGARSLILSGNNSEIHEETSNSWTAGMEFTPERLPSFSLKLNYFDIEYTDQIQAPVQGALSTLIDQFREAGLAIRRGDIPDPEFDALVQKRLNRSPRLWLGCTIAGVSQVNPEGSCSYPVANINALVDARLTNIAEARSRGLDMILSYRLGLEKSALNLGFNATYTFDDQQQLSSDVATTELVDTPYRPLRIRLRSSVSWDWQHWSLSGFINYSSQYDNTLTAPPQKVASWTTVDLNARYDISSAWLKDTTLMMNVLNALDAPPPRLENPGLEGFSVRASYDYANADPVGRLFALTIVKRW